MIMVTGSSTIKSVELGEMMYLRVFDRTFIPATNSEYCLKTIRLRKIGESRECA
jgi:hypothetical protein